MDDTGDMDALHRRIGELELLVQSMRQQMNREELLDLPWAGNLGTWIWSVPSDTVVCNDLKILNLGFTQEEIPAVIGYGFFTDLLHPDDYGPVMEQMRRHLYQVDPVYEVSYRIRHKDGSWRWYYDRGKVTQRSEEGKPLQVVGIVFDITRQKEIEEQLASQNKRLVELVDHDELTKVLSRRAIFRVLGEAFDRSRTTGSPLAILMLDIDHFKRINDTWGHAVGDEVLVEVAHICQRSVRSCDAVGRIGGEEFLVVFEGLDLSHARQVAERIRRSIASSSYADGISLSISGGLAVMQDEGSDALVTLADNRLYEAKRSGRDRIVGP
jgi:diguanylate cyclase (GGDEF)-like protein/PAS domain S-box-containing protein